MFELGLEVVVPLQLLLLLLGVHLMGERGKLGDERPVIAHDPKEAGQLLHTFWGWPIQDLLHVVLPHAHSLLGHLVPQVVHLLLEEVGLLGFQLYARLSMHQEDFPQFFQVLLHRYGVSQQVVQVTEDPRAPQLVHQHIHEPTEAGS